MSRFWISWTSTSIYLSIKIRYKRESYANERRFWESSAPELLRKGAGLKIPNAFCLEGGKDDMFPGFAVLMNDMRKNFPDHPNTLNAF